MWCKNQVNLFRLATFVQNDIDPPGKKAHPAYLFGHTKDFEEPILNTGAQLFLNEKARMLYVGKIRNGYFHVSPAHQHDINTWPEKLITRKVPRERISTILSPEGDPPPKSHTGTEAMAFVLLAQENGWDTAYIVAHPIHALRAFANTIAFTVRWRFELKIHVKTGQPPQHWFDPVISNQCTVKGTQFDEAMDAEYERINKFYGNQYDVAPAETVLKYIRWRDFDDPFPVNPFTS